MSGRFLTFTSKVIFESCGLDVDGATIPPNEALTTSMDFRIDLKSNRSRKYVVCILEDADLIIPMEYGHYRRLIDIYPSFKNKTVLIRDFAFFPYNPICNIYDHLGLDQQEFRRCFRLIQKALEKLVKNLSQKTFYNR